MDRDLSPPHRDSPGHACGLLSSGLTWAPSLGWLGAYLIISLGGQRTSVCTA